LCKSSVSRTVGQPAGGLCCAGASRGIVRASWRVMGGCRTRRLVRGVVPYTSAEWF